MNGDRTEKLRDAFIPVLRHHVPGYERDYPEVATRLVKEVEYVREIITMDRGMTNEDILNQLSYNLSLPIKTWIVDDGGRLVLDLTRVVEELSDRILTES